MAVSAALLLVAQLSSFADLFESRAVLQITTSELDVEPEAARALPGDKAFDKFIREEIRVITSPAVLHCVVQRLDLDTRWNLKPETAATRLEKAISDG